MLQINLELKFFKPLTIIELSNQLSFLLPAKTLQLAKHRPTSRKPHITYPLEQENELKWLGKKKLFDLSLNYNPLAKILQPANLPLITSKPHSAYTLDQENV